MGLFLWDDGRLSARIGGESGDERMLDAGMGGFFLIEKVSESGDGKHVWDRRRGYGLEQ